MRHATPALVLALALCLPGCQAAKKASSEESAIYTYSDWSYSNTTLNNGSIAFLAKSQTKEQGKEGTSAIFIDAIAPACRNESFLVGATMDKPADKSVGRSENLLGEVRVDDLAPQPVQFTYQTKQGSKDIYFRTEDILGNNAFSKQVLGGQMIRFKFPVDKEVYNLRFTLRYAVAKARQAMQNCRDEAAFTGSGARPQATKTAAPSSAPQAASQADDDSKFFK